MARSAPVDLEKWKKRSWLRRSLERILKLFSIWM